MSAAAHADELRRLNREIKRLQALIKILREKKHAPSQALLSFLEIHNLSSYGEFKRKNLEPKPPRRVKSKVLKKKDALVFFRNEGVPNPERFYDELQQTQKVRIA